MKIVLKANRDIGQGAIGFGWCYIKAIPGVGDEWGFAGPELMLFLYLAIWTVQLDIQFNNPSA